MSSFTVFVFAFAFAQRDTVYINIIICCSSILSLVQFLFSFVRFYVNIMMMNMKQTKIKIEPKVKLNYNIYK